MVTEEAVSGATAVMSARLHAVATGPVLRKAGRDRPAIVCAEEMLVADARRDEEAVSRWRGPVRPFGARFS
ncbi:hypothetical protein ACVV2G_29655 [Streptomyces ziwulingensis]